MSWLQTGQSRISALCRKQQVEAEIQAELRFHLEMRTRENIARGMGPTEASRCAQQQFGNLNSIMDACRDVRGAGLLEVLWQDLRFAVRILLKDRGFTGVAALVLAITIGANVAIFTIVNAVLLRPLPFYEAHRLLSIWPTDKDRQSWVRASYPDFEDLRAQNRWFDRLGAYASADFVARREAGETFHLRGASLTAEVFPLLGVSAALGRTFLAGEDEPGGRAAVISHELWQREWKGAVDVVGTSLALNGQSHRIVGVMPAGFRFPIQGAAAEVWTTAATEREPPTDGGVARASQRHHHRWQLVGRLKPGVSEEQARNGLSEVTAGLAAQYPDSNGQLPSCDAVPLLDGLTQYVRPQLSLLFGATLCVLVAGCANLSNLSLARARSRQREFTVRAALGASRSRLLRQLLTESLLLALLGGVLGLVVACGFIQAIVAILPPGFPRAVEIAPDLRVLLFTGLVTLATTCLFGIAPAWRSTRVDLGPLVNENTHQATPPPKARRARNALVACEIVVAFVLLAGAGFLVRGLWHLHNVPVGFDPKNLLTFRLSLAAPNEAQTPASILSFYEKLLPRVAAMEEVDSASITSALPLIGRRWAADLEPAGPRGSNPAPAQVSACLVGPDYFQTMGIAFASGRDFNRQDRGNSARVVIITESLARTYYPNQNPLGQRMAPRVSFDAAGPVEREIIGVVNDVKFTDLSVGTGAALFIPFAQCVAPEMKLIVRSEVAPETILSGLRVLMADLEKDAALFEPATMEQHLATVLSHPRLNSTLLAACAVVAVLLSAIGLYGVTAYSVAQRRREIGIRLALGVTQRAVFRLMMSHGLRILRWAIPAGAVCTLLGMHLLREFLYAPGRHGIPALINLQPWEIIDAAILPLAGLVVAALALAACWLPARRAMKVDPMIVLRCE